MNYFPYFRGKQFELICIRENAELISKSKFIPIIEPVKEQSLSLDRALKALELEQANFLIVANPSVGAHAERLSTDVITMVNGYILNNKNSGWIFRVRNDEDVLKCVKWCQLYPKSSIFHDGYSFGKKLSEALANEKIQPVHHVFSEDIRPIYQKNFKSKSKIILSTGFKKQSNKDYSETELFTELNVVYQELNMTGFGDYLVVGSDYSESGGPAYAVAIHITFVDEENDGAIFVNHYVSDTVNTPTDPAGKFREALVKLNKDVNSKKTKILRTMAIEEFLKLHETGHFPGLGYVKKLSMQHHLELISSL